MSFGDHISWLGRLSAQASFESEKLKFLKGVTGESNQIDSGQTKLNKEIGRAEGLSYDPEVNKVENFSHSFDDFILQKTKRYTGNYIFSIIEPIAQEDIEAKITAWINILEHTQSRVEDISYYDNYPGYKKSISISIGVLQKERKSNTNDSSSRGDKKQQAYKLQPYLDIIQSSTTHDEAVAAIKNQFPDDFKWDRPAKNLIFTTREGINKSQVSYALELIAKIKWPDSYPSSETIRKVLLK